jgi:hypothetical protein
MIESRIGSDTLVLNGRFFTFTSIFIRSLLFYTVTFQGVLFYTVTKFVCHILYGQQLYGSKQL